jgi:septum formation protein
VRLVLGADTTVVIDDLILAKPDDEAHARAMLERLSGRTHEVLTGVALVGDGREDCAVACTRVWFQAMTPEEIAWYVASGEPVGKAGAYAIQGLASRFIDRIEGSHPNVMGLPVELVYRMIRGRKA